MLQYTPIMLTCENESSKVINFGFKHTTYTYIFIHTGDIASDITRCLTQQFILYCIIYIIYYIIFKRRRRTHCVTQVLLYSKRRHAARIPLNTRIILTYLPIPTCPSIYYMYCDIYRYLHVYHPRAHKSWLSEFVKRTTQI